jgi:hypothetical protein
MSNPDVLPLLTRQHSKAKYRGVDAFSIDKQQWVANHSTAREVCLIEHVSRSMH